MADGDERLYPKRPLIGVSALVAQGSEILVVRRARPPRTWSLPGGLVEVGETLEAAVRREVSEETGLVVQIERFLKTLDVILHDEAGAVKYHYVLAVFAGRAVGGTLFAGDDAEAAEWITVQALRQRPTTPGVVELIEEFATHTPLIGR